MGNQVDCCYNKKNENIIKVLIHANHLIHTNTTNRHFHLQRLMRIVSHQLKVFQLVILNILALLLYPQLSINSSPLTHSRKRTRLSFDLLQQRFLMIHIHVRIANRMHEFARLPLRIRSNSYLQSRDMRQQNR